MNGSEIINALMEYIPESIFFKDLNSRFIRINRSCADKFGIDNPKEAIGKTDFDFFSEEHAKQAYKDEQHIIKTGKPIIGFEEKETFKDKADRWTYTTKMPLYNRKGEIIGTFGITRDITDMKEAEEELKESRSQIEAILHSTADGIYATDKEGKVIMFNNKFLDLWKVPEKFIDMGSNYKLLDFVSDQLMDPRAFVKRIYELNKSNNEGVDIIYFKNGKIFEHYSCPLKQDNEIIGRVWTFRDITEQKKAEERIWYLSCHDKLTGLYNRAYFEEELKRLNTRRQLPLSVIFCDVNGLKEMNDNYGYDKGDLLLCKVAEILKDCFRTEDIVVRWGGDEFITVLPNTDEKSTDDIIDRIYRRCELESEQGFPVSVSVGKAIKNKRSQNIDLIINQAEKRMVMNKKAMKAGV
jgi:diguanylate cyclase (GGDEF)-like protein/PAS domain S-box-containing protein